MSKFALVLPVLFLEYLAISLTKSIIPKLLVDTFDDKTYFAVGIMETVKVIFILSTLLLLKTIHSTICLHIRGYWLLSVVRSSVDCLIELVVNIA